MSHNSARVVMSEKSTDAGHSHAAHEIVAFEVLEQLGDGIAVFDAELRTVYANRAARELLGSSEDAPINVLCGSGDDFLAHLRPTAATGDRPNNPAVIIDPDHRRDPVCRATRASHRDEPVSAVLFFGVGSSIVNGSYTPPAGGVR